MPVLLYAADPMTDARSGSGNTLGSLGIITIGGAVAVVAVFFVVQCYRGWQRWSKARQTVTGQSRMLSRLVIDVR